MKMKTLVFVCLLPSLILLSIGCENFVTDIDPLIEAAEDSRLNNESQIPFILNGVTGSLASYYDGMVAIVSNLSDDVHYNSALPGASFISWAHISTGYILLDNSAAAGNYSNMHRLRFYADDMVRRLGEMTISDATQRDEALFWGYFVGGIARWCLATYFGLDENTGGSTFDRGPFIPSAEVYDAAIEKFNAALGVSPSAYLTKVVNSWLAKSYLYKADYANCRAAANNGLVQGDPDYQLQYSVEDQNTFYNSLGRMRTQAGADPRIKGYIDADPLEANRLVIEDIVGADGVTYQRQAFVLSETDPLYFIGWRENELMLAEMDIRDGANAAALTRINAIRASHGLADLAAVDMDVLITERDKELWLSGVRLPDQRRFDMWHLPADTWKYLPIPESERLINENIN